MLTLYNSLGKAKQEFKPIADIVGLYTCGPTVYNYAHIGNLRTYIFGDILKRILKFNSFRVQHVMNITDVGHLTSDADAGEDKLEKGAAREGKTVWDVAKFYTQAFMSDLERLNILTPDVIPKATDHIPEQIVLIQELEKKGFAYDTPEAVYFDLSKFPDYTKLSGQKLAEKLTGVRSEVIEDKAKRNSADFALWFKRVGKFENHTMHWDSPWGDGFPGWHIECSAMSVKYLGQPFDIHTGGIDHLSIHHPNEIAQSEAAFDKPLANYWLHAEFLLLDEGRMGKSEGNFITLEDVIKKGFSPLAYRYLVLSTHYRTKLNFTWESLTAAQNTLNNLYQEISVYDPPSSSGLESFEKEFELAINDDLNTAKALGVVWDMLKSENDSSQKLASLIKFDEVLGLKIKDVWDAAKLIPETVQELAKARDLARANKDFAKSDELRKAIESNGYLVEDTADGTRLKKSY
jgi:cysteinyl-tRNA synthetase